MIKIFKNQQFLALMFLSLLIQSVYFTLILPNSCFIPKMEMNGSSPEFAGYNVTQPNAIDEIAFNWQSETNKHQGILEGSDYKVFWFLQITDTQMVWWEWGKNYSRGLDDGRVKKLRTFFNTTQKVIDPVFIVNTGDCVDSSYEKYILRDLGQREGEWAYYNATLSEPEMGLNASYYFDMPGNHDVYRSPGYTHFLKYSFSGSNFHTDQYVINMNLGWGNYSFHIISTPENYGLEFPFAMEGFMSQTELDWAESKLVKFHETDNVTFMLGHHELYEITSSRSNTGRSLKTMMQDYGVDAYLFGHGHVNLYENYEGIIGLETAKIDEGHGYYRIIAVDNDGISSVAQNGEEWPAGLITSPIDVHFAQGEFNFENHANPQNIRALAWDPIGIASVEWRADESDTWKPMIAINAPLYQAAIDVNLADEQSHLLEIRITNLDGKTVLKSITYQSTRVVYYGWFTWIPLYLIGGIALIVVPLAVTQHLRKVNPQKWQKPLRKTVDAALKHALLIKVTALFLLPLSFGFMDAERFTAVFSIFLLNFRGIVLSDILWIYFAGVAVWMPLQGLSLSRKFSRTMSLWTFFSLFFECFLLIFYILHYPSVAWLSIGYYVLIAMDLRIWKRSKQLRKEIK